MLAGLPTKKRARLTCRSPMETTASSMFRGAAAPALDPISTTRRIDFDAPMLLATIGGRPVVLARPDQRRASAHEPADLTVPLTMSRFRRAIDIERDMVAAPYVPSPLFGAPNMQLAGYYTQGMTHDEAKALSAKMSPEERQAVLQKAVSSLPSCYSQTFRDCVKGQKGKREYPGCSAVNDGWVANWDSMEKLVDDLPYCEEPIPVVYLAVGAVAAFALGVGLGMLVR